VGKLKPAKDDAGRVWVETVERLLVVSGGGVSMQGCCVAESARVDQLVLHLISATIAGWSCIRSFKSGT
jgi:hypothetical protein